MATKKAPAKEAPAKKTAVRKPAKPKGTGRDPAATPDDDGRGGMPIVREAPSR
jgi:hypothetical protein